CKVRQGRVLDRLAYQQLQGSHPGKFVVATGAEALLVALERLDLDTLSAQLRERLLAGKATRKKHPLRRLKVVEALRAGRVRPAGSPPLRPAVRLDCGRQASGELNSL